MPNHFHTAYYPDTTIAIKAGIVKLLERAAAGRYANAKIWVPGKTSVETLMKPHLTPAGIKQFQKGSFRVETITVHLVTPKIKSYSHGPTLALCPDVKVIQLLADDPYTTDLIFVPYLEKWLETYLAAYPNSAFVEAIAIGR